MPIRKKSGKSSMLHPVTIRSSCRLFLADRPTLSRPYKGVHRIMSLMNSSCLLQKRPACLVCLILMVFEMGGM